MIEIRMHGRGGQGCVVASTLLARAYAFQGLFVQAFPEFGVERRGAPVVSFVRVDDQPILLRTRVYHPQHVVVLDAALLDFIDVTTGLDPQSGLIVLNTPQTPAQVSLSTQRGGAAIDRWPVATVDASEIAAQCGIGTRTSPIANTAILGAYARAVPQLALDSVGKAIEEAFAKASAANLDAVRKAYDLTQLPAPACGCVGACGGTESGKQVCA